MAYITDQEFYRQQTESLDRLISAQDKARAILAAQEKKTPRPKKTKSKRTKSNGSK